MKRKIVAILMVCLLSGFASLSTGCAGSGRYFQSSRQNKPHAYRNRIYNPADSRYLSDAR